MSYNYNYNMPQGSLPGGAEYKSPGGDEDGPTWATQAQSYPRGRAVPSDEALMMSLYQQLLKDRWTLLYMPADDQPDEYGLPPSLTGNSIWLQRKRVFFRAHREIRERDVFVAHRRTFFGWIQDRFRPGTVGTCGATQNLCLIFSGYVFWIDRMAASPPAFDFPPSVDCEGYGRNYYVGGSYYQGDSSYDAGSGYPEAQGSGSGSQGAAPSVDERIQGWWDNISRRQ